jgi:hypothetical protein
MAAEECAHPWEYLVKSAMVALFTGYIGYRLGLRRERRREWNTLVEPLRKQLLNANERPGYRYVKIDAVTAALVRERLWCGRRRGFDRAVKEYWQSIGEENRDPDGMGGFSYRDPSRITHAIDSLLRYVRLR